MCYASNSLCIEYRKIIAVEVEKVAEKVLRNLVIQARIDPKRYGQLENQAKKEY
jgi:hypothetical protein